MQYTFCHSSALRYWRLRCHASGVNHAKPLERCRKRPPGTAPNLQWLLENHPFGLVPPLDIMLGESGGRRVSKKVMQHVYTGPTPEGCFLSIDDSFIVSSPEFCFLQMADELSLIELIELGYELCGTYSLPVFVAPASNDENGIPASRPSSKHQLPSAPDLPAPTSQPPFGCTMLSGHSPLTTRSRLEAFVARMSRAKGRKLASRAIRYIVDGSASPMETRLTMLLTLPYMLGGYGLPLPEMNSKIVPARSAKRSASKKYYSCDMFWPAYELAVEYDSNAYHTGSDRIASDSKRRNTLASIGITVITVTNRQLYDIAELEKAVRLIAGNIGRRLQFKNPGFAAAHRKLHKMLLLGAGLGTAPATPDGSV